MQESKLKPRCLPKTMAFNQKSQQLKRRKRINTDTFCIEGTQIEKAKYQSVSQKPSLSVSYNRQQFLNFCAKPKLSIHTEQSEQQHSEFTVNNFITTSKKKSIFNLQFNTRECSLQPRPQLQNQQQKQKSQLSQEKKDKFRGRFYTVQFGQKSDQKSELKNMTVFNILRYKRLEPYFLNCYQGTE